MIIILTWHPPPPPPIEYGLEVIPTEEMEHGFNDAIRHGKLGDSTKSLTVNSKNYKYKPCHFTDLFDLLSAHMRIFLKELELGLMCFDTAFAFQALCRALPEYRPARVLFTIGDCDNLSVAKHTLAACCAAKCSPTKRYVPQAKIERLRRICPHFQPDRD